MFLQDPPQPVDQYAADPVLHAELRRRLPPEVLAANEERFAALGRATATELHELSEQAEAQLPEHIAFNAWGRRVDEIRVSPAWKRLKAFSAEHGLVSSGYEGDGHRRVVQATLLHLFSASSAIYSCPLAMTDAAARVLIEQQVPGATERLLPQLLSTDPSTFITSGQWMTETAGGSDLANTGTVADHIDGLRYRLTGTKSFTSAVTSEMALTLARVGDQPGSRGLSCFCVEVVRDEYGAMQDIEVNRLKDKLGTRALPTAELTLSGVEATLVGDLGRGVPTIATMLNVTRFHNAVSSASCMAKALYLARDYAGRRMAFGKLLREHPLHAWTLDLIEADYAGALALSMEVAARMAPVEDGAEDTPLRALIPLAKLTLGKQAAAVGSEAIECFGGAGYMEGTTLARLVRDSQVLSIWEGTTNVLSLDLLRAETKEGAWSALLAELGRRASALSNTPVHAEIRTTLGRLVEKAKGLMGDRGRLEAHARRLALTTGFVAEAILLAELGDSGARSTAHLVEHRLSAPLSL
ncbi:MAG TPA: acyl-CoA dehydrogenase family protein [Myxococcota bacterium]|nr:acyl-CoA dehydrogenase family protein [Myxococcota bacterium]